MPRIFVASKLFPLCATFPKNLLSVLDIKSAHIPLRLDTVPLFRDRLLISLRAIGS
jgi:hypothetical protein